MKRRLELLVPLVASNGNRWHEIRRTVEYDAPPNGLELEFALAVEAAGIVAGSSKLVPAPVVAMLKTLELDPIVLDPTGDPNEPAIRDEHFYAGPPLGRGALQMSHSAHCARQTCKRDSQLGRDGPTARTA